MRVRRPAAAAALLVLVTGGCARPGVEPGPPVPDGSTRTPAFPVVPATGALAPGAPLPDTGGVRSFVDDLRPSLDGRRLAWDPPRTVPTEARAYVLSDRVPGLEARTDRLARALGLDPSGRTRAGATLRYEAGEDSVLVVSTRNGQQWTYARDGAGCTDIDGTQDAATLAGCARTSERGESSSDPRHSPVPVTRARTQARPVLAALGLDSAAGFPRTGWGATLIEIDPTLQGRSSAGIATGVLVDGSGVQAATGWLGSATPAATYPVRPPSDLLGREGVVWWQPQCPSPLPEGVTLSEECSRPAVRARRVRLGYVPWRFGDRLHLVPTWLGDDDRARVVGLLPALPFDLLPEPFQHLLPPPAG